MKSRSEVTEANIKELGGAKLLPLIVKYSWPAIVTMTINQLYNVVDKFYIGHGCGKEAIAGLALTTPIMIVLIAVGVLIGMGCSTILSIRLGAGDRHDAEKALGQCVAMKLLFGFIITPILFFWGIKYILGLLSSGVTPKALRLANQYLSLTIFFNIFAHLGFGLSACMRAEGSPKESMYCMMIGCITNIILDPFFIFDKIPIPWTNLSIPGLGLRVAGAAWATNISMIVTCSSALWFYIKKKSVVRLRLRRIRLYKGLTTRALAIGLSPFLMQVMASLISFSFNYAFAKYTQTQEAGTIQVSAYGVNFTVMLVCFIPIMGVQQGVAPIIGFNWGAANYKRVRDCFVLGIKLTALTCFASCFVSEFFAPHWARAFADDADVIRASTFAIRVANSMIWGIFINAAATTYFQATGRPRTAIILSLLRQCICILPIVWILPYVMKSNPILAIWISMPISDIVAQIATLFPLFKELRFLKTMIANAKTSANCA